MAHIRDKTLWKATELAYKYMLKEKNFDKAVTYYSKKYDIDYDVLSHEVKKMQKSESKGKKPYKRNKIYRESYGKERKLAKKQFHSIEDFQDLVQEWKSVGADAHNEGNEKLAELCRKSILAIVDLCTKADEPKVQRVSYVYKSSGRNNKNEP